MEQLEFEFARRAPLPPPLALDAETEKRVVALMAEVIVSVYEIHEMKGGSANEPDHFEQ